LLKGTQEHRKWYVLTGLNTVTAYGHVYNVFIHTFHSLIKMDSSTTADITQLSEIPKSMGFLFLLQIFTQKQTCPVCLYIMPIQPQHYTTWPGCSTGGLAVSNHTSDQTWIARPLPFLESLAQVWHTLVSFLHFPEGWSAFLEAAWDCQHLLNIRWRNWSVKISYISFCEDKKYCTGVMCGVKRQGGRMRSKVHVRPTVLIHLKNTAIHKLQYLEFVLYNGVRWAVKQSNKIIHGRKNKCNWSVATGPSSHFDKQGTANSVNVFVSRTTLTNCSKWSQTVTGTWQLQLFATFMWHSPVVLYRIINIFIYVIWDLIGNNNNSIANCSFYLTNKSSQPEDGS